MDINNWLHLRGIKIEDKEEEYNIVFGFTFIRIVLC